MLSLPDKAVLDKTALIGGCAKLDLVCDAARLRAEVEELPQDMWGQRGGRVGVHNPAEAIFLRGHAPAEGNLPVEDREALDHLPYLRELINTHIPGEPLRCLLALLPAGAIIAPHIDRADYFSKTIRIHAPIVTSDAVWMYCSGECYRMCPGELWALNNSTTHGVINADPVRARIHMICDFLPDAALIEALQRADRHRGTRQSAIEGRLFMSAAQSRMA